MANLPSKLEIWYPSNHVWMHLQFHCQLMLLADSSTGIWLMGRMNIWIDVFLVIMQNLYPCLLLVLVSADISISLFDAFAISFIILHSMANLCRLIYWVGFSNKFRYNSCNIVIFWVILFGKSCYLPLYFFKIWAIFYLIWVPYYTCIF